MLSVIIPTKDRPDVFKLTMAHAIKALEGLDAEIIVVNDSSTATPDIPGSPVKIKLVQNSKSGVASARNFGVSNAQGEMLLFLDDDILIDSSNIQSILKLHQQYPDSAINLLWVYPPFLLEQIRNISFGRFLIKHGFTTMKEGLGNQWKDVALLETDVAASFFLFLHRNTFVVAGGYNEQFPHAGSEDYDFSMRMKEKGIQRLVYTESIVYHNEMDRIQIDNWLHREQKGAETRAWGFTLGRHELMLPQSAWRNSFYRMCSLARPLLLLIQKSLPEWRWLDIVNHRIIHILLGTSIFQGYNKGLKDATSKNS